MTTQPLTINDILIHFFHVSLEGKVGLTRRRIAAVEHQLRTCVEAEAERILKVDDLLVLAAERQFRPQGAVARTMHAEDLVFLLSIFLEPQWQPADPVQRGVQLRLTEAITALIVDHGLVDRHDYSCPLLDIRASIGFGKAQLKRQRDIVRASRADAAGHGGASQAR